MKPRLDHDNGSRTPAPRPARLAVLVLALLLGLAPAASRAEDGSPDGYDLVRPSPVRISVIPSYQGKANLDDGGDFNVTRVRMLLNMNLKMADRTLWGLGASHDYEDYDFTGGTGFAGGKPWDQVQRTALSGRVAYFADSGFVFLVAPSVMMARETGGGRENALSAGGTLSAARRIRPGFALGVGVGAFSLLERGVAFPFLFIDWKINDRLRLSNATPPGPTGPGGLELSCDLDGRWQAAVGVSSRRTRFRLDKEGVAPDGIGEDRSVPVWGRISWRPGRHLALGLHAGASLNGKLTVEDHGGSQVDSERYGAAPFASLSVTAGI